MSRADVLCVSLLFVVCHCVQLLCYVSVILLLLLCQLRGNGAYVCYACRLWPIAY